MREVLISIKPKWCELIASGKKTVDVRKTKPKLETPFKVYIYCTKDEPLYHSGENFVCGNEFGNGKVIGEFVCDEITGGFWISPFSDYLQKQSCLSYDEVCDYANGKPIFAWHISNLVIYDKPRELSEFITPTTCKSGIAKEMLCNACCLSSNFCTKKPKRITRPPQSWFYVEKVILSKLVCK